MDWLNNPKIGIAIGIFLLVAKLIAGIREVLDKTPQTDDNFFERAATIIGKLAGYMIGIKPKAPAEATVVPGESKQAEGVKTEIK